MLQKTTVSLFVLAFTGCWNSVFAGDTKADYERALKLPERINGKVYKQKVTPHWFDDNNQFWYRNDLSGGKREFIHVHTQNSSRREAFDHVRLAAVISKISNKEIDSERLPFKQIILSNDGSEVRFFCFDKSWKCDLQTYKLEELKEDLGISNLLPAQRKLKPSGGSQDETNITFVNNAARPVNIYWIDSRSGRKKYATLGPGKKHSQHTFAGHVWLVTDPNEKIVGVFTAELNHSSVQITDELVVRAVGQKKRSKDQPVKDVSPDKKWKVTIADHNVVLHNLIENTQTAMTGDGTADHSYSRRFYWSPDSKYLVVMRVNKGFDRKVHIVESAPKDQLQPKLHTFSYRKPGDELDVHKPCLFDVVNQKQITISDELFENPWSIHRIRWQPDSKRFMFEYNQRGHQVLRVLGVRAADGQIEAILEETSKTFLDYAGKYFTHYLDDTNEIIWMSERDGWNHLYLYDSQTGQVKNQITKGQWVVRSVEKVEPDKQQVWFWAGGIRSQQDPYYLHLCRVNFDGSDLKVLTESDGTHRVEFSPDRRFLIDRWSRVDLPPVTELRSAESGDLICSLEQADWSELLATGWQVPERFVAKGRDGETDIYGVIIRPTNFDPNQSYPVIEKIYAGPHGSFVPKSFGLHSATYQLAELGFILVQIDGMGTSHRSKAFHDVCWKNIGDSGFPDRIAWMKTAAKKYSYMDLSRVGIYGGSAGGQSALRALLAYGDFYKAAVADCGCHDNRMDKIWWNELWMGWPVGPHYKEQSNVANAYKLEGKLLLIVGELDKNVDPASTMQVVDALIKANKDFETLIIPGGGHGAGGRPYGIRKRMDFFVRNLLNISPPAW